MSDTPLYDEIRRRYLLVDDMPEPEERDGRHALRALQDDKDQDDDEPALPARTAGQEDHTDPWIYAGEPAELPENP